jgi:hypothetical protein
MRIKNAVLCLVLFILSTGPTRLLAQTGSGGTIQGTIMAQQNAVISHAKVVATNIDTDVVSSAETTTAGYYFIPSLIPGTYKIKVEKQGFKSYTQENIVVNALQVVGLNIKLSVGEAIDSVTVTAAPPVLDSENATITVNVENETYTALPLNMDGAQRDPTNFASLTPGYSGGGRSGSYNGAGGDTNGDSSSGAVTYLDGLQISQGDNRQVSLAVSVDAIDQFQVTSSGANVSQTGMGSQNYNVKHGTNNFHGTYYDYMRNTAFDSWNFFAKATTVTQADGTKKREDKPAEHQTEMGFNFGGPIKRNKMFNFVSGEVFRYTAYVNPYFMTVPTKAMKNGDFSALDYPIYDPNSLTVSGSKYTATQFTNNTIPSSRISNISKNLLQFLPDPNEDGYTNNYLTTHQSGNDNYEITERFDYVLTPRQRISILGNVGKRGFIGYDYNKTSVLPVPYVNGVLVTQFMDSGIIEHTFIVSSNMVNQFKVGYIRMNAPVKNPSEQFGSKYSATTMGIGNIPAGGASDDFPAVTLSGGEYGYSAWYSPTGYTSVNHMISIHDDFSWAHGKHLITAGFDLQDIRKNSSSWNGQSAPLSLTYNSSVTKGFSTSSGTSLNSSSGDSLATFLLGGVTSTSITYANYSTLGTRVRPFSPFIQDDWKVKPNLTVNVGLRWDIYPPVVEAQNRGSFMNPALTNPDTGTSGAMSYYGFDSGEVGRRTAGKTYYGNFNPRVGFSYLPSRQFVVRGGFGIMVSRNGEANSTTGTTGINKKTSYTTTINGEQPAFYLDNNNANFPAWSTTITKSVDENTGNYYNSTTASYPTASSVNMAYVGTSVRPPTVYNWNLGIEHSIRPWLVLQINYAGSASRFLSSDKDYMGTDVKYNVIGKYLSQLPNSTDSATKQTFLADAQARYPGIALPYSNYGGSSATISHMLNRYPQYSSVSPVWGPYANANYHGLQATLNQKKWHDFSYTANFTWSKAQDTTGTYPATGDVVPANIYIGGTAVSEDSLAYTFSAYDQPYNFHAYGQYKLPFGKGIFGGGNKLVRQTVGEWQLSGIYSIASGRPLSFSGSSLYYNPDFHGSARINGKYGHDYLAGQTSPRYIDINAFMLVPRNKIGNVKYEAPYNLRYPHSSGISLAAMRSFNLPKDLKFIFRAEVFNLTNHVEFKGITTSFPCTYSSSQTDFGDGGGACTLKSSDAFGRVSSQANDARDWQFSGRINF